MADMEAQVFRPGLDWIVLRGGMMYGPDTGCEAHWLEQAQAGELRVPGDGAAYLSLIHQHDFAQAVCRTCRTAAGAVFNVVDDEPVRWMESFDFIAREAGARLPDKGGSQPFPSQRVANALTKPGIGWQPHYRSYREGLGP
jgi:nucleoside-diphosphate-sugar epimerase